MKYIYLILLSSIGFLISFYIYYSKKKSKQLYCPIGHSCNFVVESKYGKTFGIENTIPGMVFYLLIFAYGTASLQKISNSLKFFQFINQNIFKWSYVYYLIVIASIFSVLFSIYLTSIQAFALRKWCFYCIISSLASVLILIVLIV